MKAIVSTNSVMVELTERNLKTLLLKLKREDSARTLEIGDESGHVIVSVRAVPDEEHYADRTPGAMHPIEEAQLAKGPAVDDILYIDDDGDAVYDYGQY